MKRRRRLRPWVVKTIKVLKFITTSAIILMLMMALFMMIGINHHRLLETKYSVQNKRSILYCSPTYTLIDTSTLL